MCLFTLQTFKCRVGSQDSRSCETGRTTYGTFVFLLTVFVIVVELKSLLRMQDSWISDGRLDLQLKQAVGVFCLLERTEWSSVKALIHPIAHGFWRWRGIKAISIIYLKLRRIIVDPHLFQWNIPPLILQENHPFLFFMYLSLYQPVSIYIFPFIHQQDNEATAEPCAWASCEGISTEYCFGVSVFQKSADSFSNNTSLQSAVLVC